MSLKRIPAHLLILPENPGWPYTEEAKKSLDWWRTGSTTRKWWNNLEIEYVNQPEVIAKLCWELIKRNSSIPEFFVAVIQSGSKSLGENLAYLDKMTTKGQKDSSNNSTQQDETTDISKGAKLEKYMTEPAEKRLDNLIGAVKDKDE